MHLSALKYWYILNLIGSHTEILLLTTAYMCLGVSLANPPSFVSHFSDHGPWKFASSNSFPPSKMVGATVALYIYLNSQDSVTLFTPIS